MRDRAPQERAVIRVSHWQCQPSSVPGDEGEVVCVWDSHPRLDHRLDFIIAPPSIAMPEDLAAMPVAAQWLKTQHRAGSIIASVCAGAFVLGESGLINGRKVTTHWAFADQLAQRFPKVDVACEYMIVDDGDIITAGAILAWTDLGLTLVQRLMGREAMLATARFLLTEPPRQRQAPFREFLARFDHGDSVILSVQHHLHAKSEQTQNIEDLAAMAGMGARTFMRRFAKATGQRPTEYLQHVRIAKARESLEQTRLPIEHLAYQVGYHDPSAFRKIFHKLVGMRPSEYRKRFGTQARQDALTGDEASL
ncbi:GlxA family transcriptional regulator [Woodsholea maritima]|uniref:GlxA family transcriptional regulator n=1 Tax=Woodsholea maritima TaxID=240237 RepID=UPI001F3EF551|nr:helix-turn-helix domain-containing protein [Woodsholea maritima]